MFAGLFDLSKWSPPRFLVCGFAVIILLGGLVLSLPVSSAQGTSLRYLDAVFTATSATCVTGLVVVDTGTYYSIFGQVVLLLLIQIGGLGFMTMATLFALVLRKRISLRERMILQEAMNQPSMQGIVQLIRRVFRYSVAIEAAGALLFTLRWSLDMPIGRAAYFGVFHAVSFFNNAGFDLFGEYHSLTTYAEDPMVNLIAMALIVLGGLGFVVLADLLEYPKSRCLSLHSKIVLCMTGILIVSGAIAVFAFEYGNTLGPLGGTGKILASFFQSVTARTAGANTVDISALHQATLFFVIFLMFVGAAPGSTAGGIKVTTFATLVGGVHAMVRGKDDIVFFRYRLARGRLLKALTITMLAMALIAAVTMALCVTENAAFIRVFFETVSAFATVGLSTGLTPDLSDAGRVLIACMMFAGRLGPLTLAYALGPKSEKELYRYPEGKLIIG
ncbi:TrkH family potassium uptake protein [Cohnella candidum]|uniref:TrkH family potassium uptake protein n=1 Tax=Cohnella candidum TaxID=2674991 RepID=UPI001F152D26|nr:TrkH family potassium uptake protein [Cohnella candidum]